MACALGMSEVTLCGVVGPRRQWTGLGLCRRGSGVVGRDGAVTGRLERSRFDTVRVSLVRFGVSLV